MRGHVHKRGQTWTYVVDGGRDPATGRRRQRTKGGFRTKRLAEEARSAALQSMHDGSFVATDPQTVGEWIDRWLVAMAPKIRASTLRDYRMGQGRVKARLGLELPRFPRDNRRPVAAGRSRSRTRHVEAEAEVGRAAEWTAVALRRRSGDPGVS